jgi:hypothetical protein
VGRTGADVVSTNFYMRGTVEESTRMVVEGFNLAR